MQNYNNFYTHTDKSSTGPALTTGGAVEKAHEKVEVGSGKNGVKNDSQSSKEDVPPPEQASFLELLGLQHVSKVNLLNSVCGII